ncbi:hypothetical protein GQ44DRAFT_720502 [Phaeosphaeriaceae sp. PMI808]|nr:hypothetical protein GQ44DRAFT_720502 [Phaeosphaeriaceae sp. PMI808]
MTLKFLQLFLRCLWWSLSSACRAVPLRLILLRHMRNLTLTRRARSISVHSLSASCNVLESKTVGIINWVSVSRRTSKNHIDIVAHL